jgi:hypothetical protein
MLTATGATNYQWNTGETTASITVSPTSTTTYSVTGTNSSGCSGTASVTVTVGSSITVAANASPPSICAGGTSTLTATGATSYQWNTGETTASITVSPGSTTTYSVTGTNSSGCSGTASVTISVGSGLNVTATASPSTVCKGSSSTITASGATNYHWNTGETTSSITVTPAQQTTYTVTGDNGSGCSGTATVTVGVSDPPTVTAAASPATICAGMSSTLTASGNANVYLWSTQQSGSTITVSPTTTTTYGVAGYNSFNCSSVAEVTVTVSGGITATASPSTICSGSSSTLTASGGTKYHWSTGETTASITVSPTQQTTYTVTGDGGAGCSGTASVTVSVSQPPTVTAAASPSTICPGASSTLTASGNANVYQWNTGQSGQTITVSPSSTTSYFVAGYNSFNCRTIAQVDVTVDQSACSSGAAAASTKVNQGQSKQTRVSNDNEPMLDVPDAIAVYPNPSNGTFYIKNAPANSEVAIYNQTGQKISSDIIESEDEPVEVNLTQQVKGIYFVRITQSGKPVHQSRLIKIE